MFTAVLSNFADAQESVALAENSAGSAARENARYMESLAAKMNALKATFQEIVLGDGGISQFVGKMLDLANSFLKFLNAIDVGKLAEFIAMFGVGGAIIKGLIGIGGALATINLEAGVFAGILGVIGSGAVPIVGIAVALGTVLGIFNILNDKALEFKDATDALSETKDKIGELQTEYNKLYSNKDNLNDLEKKRLTYLEEQLKVLKKQGEAQAKTVTQTSESSFKYSSPDMGLDITSTMYGYTKVSAETLTGLEAIEAALEDAKSALDNYVDGYSASEQTIDEYNEALKAQVDQFDGLINSYAMALESGGTLNDEQLANISSMLALKQQYAELTGETYNYSDAEARLAAQVSMAHSVTESFNPALEQTILKMYGLEAGSTDAATAVNLYKLECINASQTDLASALQNNTDGFLAVAQAAGIAAKGTALYYKALAYKYTSEENQQRFLDEIQSEIEKQISDAKNKLTVPTVPITPTGGGGGGDDDKKKTKKERTESKKSDLDEFIEVQRKKYVKGEILAETFYKRVQEKAKAYLKKEQITQKEYSDALKKSYDGIFDHVKEQYDRGDVSAKKYADNLKKYAKQAYDKNIIDFDKYTNYLIKGYDAQFDELDKKYERGLITGEEYYNKITKLASEANKKGYISADDKWKKENKAAKAYLDYLGDNYDKQLISAEKYYKDLLKKAKTYYKEAKITAEEYYKYIEKATQAVVDQTDLEMEAYKMYVDDRKKYADEQIDALKKQKEAQKKANDETERALKLAELQEALAKAKTKQVRVYKEGEGFVYQQDAEAVSKAQKDLNEYNLEQQQKANEDSIDASIDYWEEYKDKWDKGLDDLERTLDKKKWALKSGMEYEDWVNKKGLQNYKDFSRDYLKQLEIFTTGYTAQINAQIAALEALQRAQAAAQSAISGISTGSSSTSSKSGSSGSTSVGTTPFLDKVLKNTGAKDVKELVDLAKAKSASKKAGGSTSMPFSSFVNVNEQGDELFIPSNVNRGDMAYIGKGTGIVPHSMTQNLMEIGKFNLAGLKNFIGGGAQGGTNNVFNFDSIVLPNVSNANDFVSELKNFKNMAIQSSYAR